MSISPQPDSASDEPQDIVSVQAQDSASVKPGGEVMPWPKQNQRHAVARTQAELLARRQAIVLRVLAEFSGGRGLQGSLIAAAETIKKSLVGVRVSFGLCQKGVVSLAAISQQAEIDARTSESELLCAAMLEAMDRDEPIVTSAIALSESGMQSHRLLCAGRPDRQIVTVPVCHESEFIAVLCVERESRMPLSRSSVALIRNIADSLAPMITARRKAERGLFMHLQEHIAELVGLAIATRYMKWKAISLLLVLAVILASFWQSAHWVRAEATFVPLERRVISAPREGYIMSVETGAGNQVSAGELLLRMDTNELQLERSRWQSELRGLATQMRAAMAKADRRQMTMLAAEIDKTEAQLALADTQLERSQILAPVDGIVVSGDLSHMVGAPVSRGQLLLELAPEKGYEVHLMVDERKINKVAVGDQATLHLRASPSQALELVIEKIHPMGVVEDGANRFRVTARITGAHQLLMPGQTGAGKIDVGQASWLWVLTEDFVKWLQLKRWEWFG